MVETWRAPDYPHFLPVSVVALWSIGFGGHARHPGCGQAAAMARTRGNRPGFPGRSSNTIHSARRTLPHARLAALRRSGITAISHNPLVLARPFTSEAMAAADPIGLARLRILPGKRFAAMAVVAIPIARAGPVTMAARSPVVACMMPVCGLSVEGCVAGVMIVAEAQVRTAIVVAVVVVMA